MPRFNKHNPAAVRKNVAGRLYVLRAVVGGTVRIDNLGLGTDCSALPI